MQKSLSIEIMSLIKTLAFSFILALIAGTVVYYTSLEESLLSTLGKIIMIITIFTGGCLVSKFHGNKGLVRGLMMGTAYFIIILTATFLFVPALINLPQVIYTLLIALAAGGLGGILGIGLAGN